MGLQSLVAACHRLSTVQPARTTPISLAVIPRIHLPQALAVMLPLLMSPGISVLAAGACAAVTVPAALVCAADASAGLINSAPYLYNCGCLCAIWYVCDDMLGECLLLHHQLDKC